MKIIKLGTAFASLMILTACGETDTREKHRYTVEVEVTETNGKVQTVSQECNQLQNRCSAKFDLETPYGVKSFEVNVSNEPVNGDKVMAKMFAAKKDENPDTFTDSEYKQNAYIHAIQFGSSRFKAPIIEKVNWKPRTERKITTELNIPHPDFMKKYIELSEKEQKENFKNYYDKDKKLLASIQKELKELKAKIFPDIKAADLNIRIY